MSNVYLFCDGSVNTKTKVGVGAALYLTHLDEPIAAAKKAVIFEVFHNTSSTRLELQTFIWALNHIAANHHMPDTLKVYTDCQTLVDLPQRQDKLLKAGFITRQGRLLSNAVLYKDIFALLHAHNVQILKLKGHKPNSAKTHIEQLFTLVDRGARDALRSLY